MKQSYLLLCLVVTSQCFSAEGVKKAAASTEPTSNSFFEVWKQVSTGVPPSESGRRLYPQGGVLPQHSLSMDDLKKSTVDIYQAVVEALENKADFFDTPRKKLIRPNGICLAGKWKATEDSPYTGVFKKGVEVPIIARASVAFEKTKSGELRAFGIAGKLFPTTNPHEKVETANFFMIDDNGGTYEKHFTNAKLLTKAKVSYWNIVKQGVDFISTVLTLQSAQKGVDPEHSKVRQLYPLSESMGVREKDAVTPEFMKIVGARDLVRQNIHPGALNVDFREDLRVNTYKSLRFDVFVSGKTTNAPEWKKVAQIHFTEDAVSDVCDLELRFSHPKWKK